ncbi:MAG: hypothetical protein A3B10_02880 [Candidatus Doudnabacteria bacterium RIFCSPLOWO2_01_FULL_44_21]|uniref:Uncharacterized protein n=1 Tax=Candidatus Doudnabacteria bacterium RIFCSPLOWO2_01_FULL_44_21 TaxID=1817841 RepID=A0A1F5Q2R1_9BACT|nr:MAG: hypothetical protein A3B10_02880 [Candidatus Doudnabacteria bacterium RIFCSPLOWO2_01_FULL_44_21]
MQKKFTLPIQPPRLKGKLNHNDLQDIYRTICRNTGIEVRLVDMWHLRNKYKTSHYGLVVSYGKNTHDIYLKNLFIIK